MARTINEIQQEILEAKANDTALNGLTSTSKSAIWRLLIYIVAFAIWTLEKLFDLHSSEVDAKLEQLKPHTARWYRNKALAFQYGFDLIQDTDRFDNNGKTPEEIEAAKIIKYSAVTESEDESRLIVKIATEQDGKLTPVTTEQQAAFEAYLFEVKDAGVRTTVINYLPDRLKLNIRIVRDMLVLDANGMDITTGKYPVNDAIEQFMKELPFNGELSLQKLVDKIQKVKGVKDLALDLASTAWIDADVNGYGDWENIDISKIPVSGYFAVNLTEDNETKSVITYE